MSDIGIQNPLTDENGNAIVLPAYDDAPPIGSNSPDYFPTSDTTALAPGSSLYTQLADSGSSVGAWLANTNFGPQLSGTTNSPASSPGGTDASGNQIDPGGIGASGQQMTAANPAIARDASTSGCTFSLFGICLTRIIVIIIGIILVTIGLSMFGKQVTGVNVLGKVIK